MHEGSKQAAGRACRAGIKPASPMGPHPAPLNLCSTHTPQHGDLSHQHEAPAVASVPRQVLLWEISGNAS